MKLGVYLKFSFIMVLEGRHIVHTLADILMEGEAEVAEGVGQLEPHIDPASSMASLVRELEEEGGDET